MTIEDASGASYKILSLDGGGTWAILQAMALADLYGADTPGREIVGHFDLVVANSGGSLVAAGLWANMQPGQLVKEFKSESVRERVFSRLSLLKGFPRSVLPFIKIGPKYYSNRKLDALRAIMNYYCSGIADQPIQTLTIHRAGDTPRETNLLILAYDYDSNRAKYLRTSPRSGAGAQLTKVDYRTTLAEAVHASTNAPVNYFDAPAEISYGETPIRAWDGAIAGYNNPILAGITEALANGVDRKAISVLSLGTSSRVLPMRGGDFTPAHDWLAASPYNRGWWIVGDLRKLSMSIIENPPDVATYVAYFMIDDQLDWRGAPIGDPIRAKTRIVRLNPLMQPIVVPGTKIFDVPGWHSDHPDKLAPEEFRHLMTLDIDAIRESEVELIRRFGQLWLDEWVNNQPILADSTKLECELGQRWYSQGRERARVLGLAPDPVRQRAAEERAVVASKTQLEDAMRGPPTGGS